RYRLSSPILRLLPPARSTPVTSISIMMPSLQAAKKKEGVGHPTPSSYFRLSPFRRTLEGLSLPLVRSSGQHPTFQKNHTKRNRNRIDIGFARCRRLQEGIVEGRDGHLSPCVAIVAVPSKEHSGNVLSHFKEGIFVVIL